MRLYGYLLTALALVGCDKGDDSGTSSADADGDGFTVDVDCDDSDASISPGAAELCDSIDNDCDGVTDEDPTDGTAYFADNDGDGYGSTTSALFCSAPGSGYVDNSDDCDDAYARAYPGGDELCDGIDNDCDGTIDNGAGDLQDFFADGDNDGYGDPQDAIEACAAPSGYVDNSEDCNDTDAAVSPETVWYADADGDSYGDSTGLTYTGCEAPTRYTSVLGDCDDTDGEIYPGAEERCNAIDDDCDGSVPTEEFDGDKDGAPACADDCDDTNPDIYVGAVEACSDGVDNNCNGRVDEQCPSVMSTAADIIVTGESSSDYNGLAVSAGDINGDGYDDLVTGAYYADSTATTYTGEVYAFFGPLSTASSLNVNSADLTLNGTTQYDYFGYRVRANSDIDGDGFEDLMVSAYGNDKKASTGGASYLFYGPITSNISDASADASVYGASSSDYVGYHHFETGDYDGDGDEDFIVNSYYYDVGTLSSVGLIGIFDEPVGEYDIDEADMLIYGASGNSYVGYSLHISGDANGDGTNDILYGEYYNDIAYMIYGPITDTAVNYADADLVFVGNQSYGATQFGAGDINGDGHDDYIYGSYYDSTGATYAGGIYVFYGPITSDISVERDYDAHIYATTSYDYLGSNLYGRLEIEDLDGDGSDDVVVTNSYTETISSSYSQGGLFIFYGPLSGDAKLTEYDQAFYGTANYEYLGRDLGLGDIDNDGTMDLLTGAYGASSYAGQTYVIFGSSL